MSILYLVHQDTDEHALRVLAFLPTNRRCRVVTRRGSSYSHVLFFFDIAAGPHCRRSGQCAQEMGTGTYFSGVVLASFAPQYPTSLQGGDDGAGQQQWRRTAASEGRGCVMRLLCSS